MPCYEFLDPLRDWRNEEESDIADQKFDVGAGEVRFDEAERV
jgi:hypothetical protein